MLEMEFTILIWTFVLPAVCNEDKEASHTLSLTFYEKFRELAKITYRTAINLASPNGDQKQCLANTDPRTNQRYSHQCLVIQEKELIKDDVEIPLFLKNNRTQCQVQEEDMFSLTHAVIEHEMLKCGQTDIYIRPECVCSFYNVFNGDYHRYSSCPEGAELDIVTQLKCSYCKKYSFNKNGPCINGGKLICKGEEVAPKVTCQCPPSFEGAFCEKKIEQNLDRISSNYSYSLAPCSDTWRECVTYSRNMRYAYRCRSDTLQDRPELPLCLDTENTTVGLPESSCLDTNEKKPECPHAIRTETLYFLLFLFLVLGAFSGMFLRILWEYRVCKTSQHNIPNV